MLRQRLFVLLFMAGVLALVLISSQPLVPFTRVETSYDGELVLRSNVIAGYADGQVMPVLSPRRIQHITLQITQPEAIVVVAHGGVIREILLRTGDIFLKVPDHPYNFEGTMVVLVQDGYIARTGTATAGNIYAQITQLMDTTITAPSSEISFHPEISERIKTYGYCVDPRDMESCRFRPHSEQIDGSSVVRLGTQLFIRTPGEWVRHDMQMCPVYIPVSEAEVQGVGLQIADFAPLTDMGICE